MSMAGQPKASIGQPRARNQCSGPPYWMTPPLLRKPHSAGRERNKPKSELGSGGGGQTGRAQTMAEWETQQCANTEIHGCPAAAIWALDIWRSSTPNFGRSNSRLMCDHREQRSIAKAWSEDSGSLQRLTGRDSANGTHGDGPRAETSEAAQPKGADSPCPQHHIRDPLGPGALRHPWEQRSRPSGQFSPRCKRKHCDRPAIHLGLEQG